MLRIRRPELSDRRAVADGEQHPITSGGNSLRRALERERKLLAVDGEIARQRVAVSHFSLQEKVHLFLRSPLQFDPLNQIPDFREPVVDVAHLELVVRLQHIVLMHLVDELVVRVLHALHALPVVTGGERERDQRQHERDHLPHLAIARAATAARTESFYRKIANLFVHGFALHAKSGHAVAFAFSYADFSGATDTHSTASATRSATAIVQATAGT